MNAEVKNNTDLGKLYESQAREQSPQEMSFASKVSLDMATSPTLCSFLHIADRADLLSWEPETEMELKVIQFPAKFCSLQARKGKVP